MEFPKITPVLDYIVRTVHPQQVILFNRKTDINGQTISFKLCVVAEVADRREAEKQLYLGAECDIPFDLLIYSPEEWQAFSRDERAFAHRIATTGRVLFG